MSERVRRWVPAGLFVALLTIHLLTVLNISAPQIHFDEGGYLTLARHLATGVPVPDQQYYPGYSALLAPVFWLSSDPTTAYKLALAVNALFMATVGPLAWWFVQLMSRTRSSTALGAAIAMAVGVCPSNFAHPGIAWAEALIVPGFLALACLFARMVRSTTARWWLAAAGLATYLPFANPNTLPVLPAFLGSALLSLRRGPGSVRRAGALTAGVAGTALIGWLLKRSVHLEPVGPVPHIDLLGAHSVGKVLVQALDPRNLPQIGLVFAGQGFYIAVASLGLVPLGLLAAGAAARRLVADRSRGDATDRTAAFALVSLVGVWLLASVFLSFGAPELGWTPTQDSYDSLITGRYNEGVAAPLVVIGALLLARMWRRHTAQKSFAIVATATVGAGAILVIGTSGRRLLPVEANWQNVHAIRPYVLLLGGMKPVTIAISAVVVSGAIWMVARSRETLAICLVALLFAASGLHGVYGYLVPNARTRSNQRVVADAVIGVRARFARSLSCVAVDGTLPRRWHELNYWYFLPGVRLKRINVGQEEPCSDLLIGPRFGVDAAFPGARALVVETQAESALWVLPGPLSRRLTDAGWVLPEDPGGSFPGAAYRSRLTTRLAAFVRAGSSHPLELPLRVTHEGAGSPWPSRESVLPGGSFVQVEIRWRRAGRVVRTDVADLPRSLLPGQSVDVRASLATTRLPRGTYVLEVGLVHVGHGSFTEHGDRTLRRTVLLFHEVGRTGVRLKG